MFIYNYIYLHNLMFHLRDCAYHNHRQWAYLHSFFEISCNVLGYTLCYYNEMCGMLSNIAMVIKTSLNITCGNKPSNLVMVTNLQTSRDGKKPSNLMMVTKPRISRDGNKAPKSLDGNKPRTARDGNKPLNLTG